MTKTTQELLDMMREYNDYHQYLNNVQEAIETNENNMHINRALLSIIAKKNLKKADVIAKSGVETHYAYQILSGTKTPTRDKVLMLCIGMQLTVEEVQQLLKITGYPQLFGKSARDNAILFGITKKIGVIEINNLLYELGLELLL